MKIEVRPKKDHEKYFKLVKDQVNLFFKDKSINPETVVSFNFVSKTKIRTLNKKYRSLDSETDVLSFPIWESISQMPKHGTVNLGDIFICMSVLQKNAKVDKLDFKEELKKICEHSLNHLISKHH